MTGVGTCGRVSGKWDGGRVGAVYDGGIVGAVCDGGSEWDGWGDYRGCGRERVRVKENGSGLREWKGCASEGECQ